MLNRKYRDCISAFITTKLEFFKKQDIDNNLPLKRWERNILYLKSGIYSPICIYSFLLFFLLSLMQWLKSKKAIASIKIKINAYKAKTIPGAFSICYLSSKILNDINSDFPVSKTGI